MNTKRIFYDGFPDQIPETHAEFEVVTPKLEARAHAFLRKRADQITEGPSLDIDPLPVSLSKPFTPDSGAGGAQPAAH